MNDGAVPAPETTPAVEPETPATPAAEASKREAEPSVEPAAPEPAKTEAAPTEPATAEAVSPEPATAEPATAEPATAEPATAETATADTDTRAEVERGDATSAGPVVTVTPSTEPSTRPSKVDAPTEPVTPGVVRVRFAGLTDVGRIREHNEDNFLIADLTEQKRILGDSTTARDVGARGLLLTVCDGMGGAAAGEVASQMAVDVIHGIVQDGVAPTNRDLFAQRLVASIQEAGARIFLAAKSNRERRGMGTTSTVAGVYGDTLFVGQVGDSRAYLLRDGHLRQVTRDQSLVSKLIEAGQLTEAEAETYEHAHIILQALGTADTVSVDLSYAELRKGDALMLCSDGLSGLATFEQIHETMADVDDPAACAQRLIDLANEAGGHDNITVIVARFDGDLPEASHEDEKGYQPYVLLEPVEAIIAGSASTSMKVPDLPPPGSDVKHSLSIPPEMPTATRPVEPVEPPIDLDVRTRRELGLEPQRSPLGWVLLALALVVLALAGWLLLRPSQGPAPSEETPTITTPETVQVEPTQVGQATPVRAVPVAVDDAAADASTQAP
jgi:PPM family protein phosphatase